MFIMLLLAVVVNRLMQLVRLGYLANDYYYNNWYKLLVVDRCLITILPLFNALVNVIILGGSGSF